MTESQPRSPHQQPMSLRERVDHACDGFERQWRAEQAPRIEDFLEQAAEGDREQLLRELIALEMVLRDGAGHQVDPQEYQGRFAGEGQIVDLALASFHKHKAANQSQLSTEAPRPDEDSHATPPETVDLEDDIPKAIGRYEVLRVLGRGGFAVVYLARDTDLNREVALKVPRLDRFESEAALDFFVEEARKAAQLEHPAIVRVHDVQREPGLVYIVQQYLAGGDLAEHIKANRLSPPRIAELMIAIAEAVGYAHQQGYTHLDLKPANILLDQDGKPHVADFGLALHESVQQDMAGEVLGTYVYMSPEQTRGEAHRLDGRSDIWSLGVILYELLTGRRPFGGKTREKLVAEIEHRDPKPPRMADPKVPRELSRICLACLAKRATDRYPATADLVDDLRRWLEDETAAKAPGKHSEQGAAPADEPAPRIVPQGLRSFEAEHADFYLELLPGPHDREGLPKRVRFWKAQFEKTDADETFAVGLMYGPSGCGKSSLIKAGVLPRLSDHVLPIYVEATAADTEVRLIKALRKWCPEVPAEASLPELIDCLRREGGSRGRKVVIVLDQFEQWLHAHESRADSQLVPALRQCDGGGVQCLVLVRDDFWMSATRFMQALEVRLVEDHNSAAVDLFDVDHAAKVLAAFGRAYGRLPELPAEPSEAQARFLQRAVDGLADTGKVICVRLAVFAEMMKGRPWTEESLAEVGGTAGVGVTFLEETFGAPTAPPSHRLHQKAVRAVLKALLPESGTDIKGQMKSYHELLDVSGYAGRPADFDAVLGILDGEVRLITPTEPDETDVEDAETSATGHDASYYQLTHDYLVPSLRDWLTRKQKETRRGRAELRLAERAASWNAKPENRHLPSLWGWLNIRLFTNMRNWSASDRKMMGKANVFHGLRTLSAATLLAVMMLAALGIRSENAAQKLENDRKRAASLVEGVLTARAAAIPYAIDALAPLRDHALPILKAKCDSNGVERTQRLHAACALAEFGDVRLQILVNSIQDAPRGETANIVAALRHAEGNAVKRLKGMFDAEQDTTQRVRLATVLVHLGDTEKAHSMLALGTDPTERTAFIHGLDRWYGDLSDYGKPLRETTDDSFRSGLCLAVGRIPVGQVPAGEQQVMEQVLLELYQTASDGSIHSACDWALRQWNVALPAIAAEKAPTNKDWHVNTLGMTMVKIPAGSTKSFWISNREVSVAQFQRFMDDDAAKEKPTAWRGPDKEYSPTGQHPVQEVSWYDAVLFCNWLSGKENLTPCYERTGDKEQFTGKQYDAWRVVPKTNGYRLPTAAEWEYACRAQTKTYFCFGSQDPLLDQYAVYRASATQPCGTKLPNGWGVFDMHGNVYEWVYDNYDTGSARVYRGGSWYDPARGCRASNHQGYDPPLRRYYLGFRLAAVPTSREPAGGAVAGKPAVLERKAAR